MFLLNWGSSNNVRFSRTMAPPLQMLKHFKFELFFNVEPNPRIKLMAHVGSSSCQKDFNNIPKSIRVRTKVYPCSSTNYESIKSYGMEPFDSLKLLAKRKPKRSYEKTRVF
jgi:hypothetical protein